MRAFFLLAALIAESMLINSASAQGWTYIISNKGGSRIYARNPNCSGPICEVETIYQSGNPDHEYVYLSQINCNTWMDRWKYKYPDQVPEIHQSKKYEWIRTWKVMSPSSVSSAVAEFVCR